MVALFSVNDPYEMTALLRALFAAKFHAPEDGTELAGSSILAGLCERAMEGYVTAQEAGLLPGNPEHTRAVQRAMSPGELVVASVRRHLSVIAAGRGNWSRWSPAERAEYVRVVFRPYMADESLIRELAGSESSEPGATPGLDERGEA